MRKVFCSLACLILMLCVCFPALASDNEFWFSGGTATHDDHFVGSGSFAIGVRSGDFGLEFGSRGENAGGLDALVFIRGQNKKILPFVGIGYYVSATHNLVFYDSYYGYYYRDVTTYYDWIVPSFGVHLYPIDNVCVGFTYNGIRGVNGTIGLKF